METGVKKNSKESKFDDLIKEFYDSDMSLVDLCDDVWNECADLCADLYVQQHGERVMYLIQEISELQSLYNSTLQENERLRNAYNTLQQRNEELKKSANVFINVIDVALGLKAAKA